MNRPNSLYKYPVNREFPSSLKRTSKCRKRKLVPVLIDKLILFHSWMEMATKSIVRYIFTILFVSVVCCNCQSDNPGGSSWAQLQISPDSFSSMEYGNFRIEIYEHVNNKKEPTTASQKKYFYSPLGLLDHKSALSSNNRATKQPEMRFQIEMWNDKVQNEVVKHLNEMVGPDIKSNQVKVLPVEKVILVSKKPTVDYLLNQEWTNYDKSKSLRLSLSCSEQKTCDDLASKMRSNPERFAHFQLLYSLSSQTSQTKQTTISIDSVTSGQFVSTLLQTFGDKNEIFLTANDEKKMLTETATNIRMETFDDNEVGSPGTESQIINILKDLLVASKTTIKELNDKKWDSVFWHEENYRPDKTTKTLNEIVKKLDAETKKKLTDMFKDKEVKRDNINLDNKEGSNSWADVDRISSTISRKMATDSDSSSQVKMAKEDVQKLLKESRNHVQWEGDKFVPKPMQLSRINLGKFRDSQSFQDRNVRVRYTTAELSAPIKIMEHRIAESTVIDEGDNLKDQLKDIKKLLDETVSNLIETKTELSNTKIELNKKLEGTKQELAKAKVEFTKDLDGLSLKLRVNSNELSQDIKVAEENLKRNLRATSNDLANAKTTFASTRMDLSSTMSTVADLVAKLNDRTSEAVDIGKMPTSCEDLKRIGHKLSGFFSVKGSKKIEIIYCDFYLESEMQKKIGYVDVKSAPVHFYVTRDSSFKITNAPIPFDLMLINEGNGMDLSSGKFTAQRPGIYFFSFTGHARISNSSPYYFYSSLYLNGNIVGTSFVSEERSVINKFSPLTVQSTLKLKTGDKVWVGINYYGSTSYLSSLHDDGDHLTHFTGFLLEEDLVSSL